MNFEPWQWILLVAGAVMAGFSKTGIPGSSILFVAIFPNLIPARQATGVVLPMLIFADLFAYVVYRKNLEKIMMVGGINTFIPDFSEFFPPSPRV